MRRLPPHIQKRHPIVTGKYAIFTPAVNQFVEKLGDWIDSKVTGAYVYGPSRYGKTRAIKWFLKHLLEERFGGPIPLHVWNRPFAQKNPSEFYMSILDGLHHAYGGKRAGPNERLKILTEVFLATSDECDTNSVYLIVDEAQEMSTQEWAWLLALQNALDSEGYALSVFSIASHQMAYEFDLLSRTGNQHIGARFLVDHWTFPGVQSIEELSFILDGYDENSQWPPEVGVSYLAHFAPQEFERGRRLAKCAPFLWECLVALLPAGIEIGLNFPMKHVALATEDVLFDLASGTDWHEATSQDSWIEALTKHRLADHMRAISVGM
jgi:hypothetical protein